MITQQHSRAALPLALLAAAFAAPAMAQEASFEEARLFFELNATDGDLGLHAAIDGDAWKFLEIEDPAERRLLAVTPTGRLRVLGLTEITFESAEPSFDELPPADFLARFAEGIYEVSGITVEGEEIENEVRLSKLLPGAPRNVRVNGLPAAENCDADNIPLVRPPVVISWDPVRQSQPGIGRQGPVRIVRYQVFAEQVTEDPLTFSLDLPPSMRRYTVAPELIALGDREYKFEVLARAANGNQTAIESCFRVR